MTELVKHSTERSTDAVVYAVSLLHHYGFDLGGYTIAQLLLAWQELYPAAWIRLATIEALYQGRYKAISVEQILALWERRSQPLYHFNHEFERLVCDNLPESLLPSDASPENDRAPRSTAILDVRLPYHSVVLQLPSFKSDVPPESDVMLALRTLHSEEMAALASQTTTQHPAHVDPQQTYSYKLGLNEQEPPEPSGEASAASAIDPASLPETAVEQIESIAPAPTCQEAVQDAVQPEPIAPAIDRSELESTTTAEPLAVEPLAVERSPTEPLAVERSPTESLAVERSPTEPCTDDAIAPSASANPVSVPSAQTTSIARILQQLDQQELSTRAVLPGFGLLAHTLKPNLQLHLTARYQPIWLTDVSSKQPIHQFTPDPEPSNFHSKLKAVAQPTEAPEAEQAAVPPDA